MKRLASNLRFRTRLALVMFVTMGFTSGILLMTYVHQDRRIKAYVAGLTSDLLAISQLTQQHIPPTGDRKQAVEAYKKALQEAGFSSVTVASPTGEVLATTDPRQFGKKINIKKRRAVAKQDPIKISAEFRDVDVDAAIEQRTYSVQFPIIQGDKVIGYAQVRGVGDEIGELLRHTYVVRFFWILSTMLASLFAMVYLAFRFTKPIDTLVAGAHQVAQGNLYVSLPVTGSDEMGRLAQTFNQMVERLREHRELQERLNQAEKSSLLGRFAATVAHEVRNSLNFINLSIDQIRAKRTGSEEQSGRDLQRTLANIKDEVSRLNRLVNDFLAAGRQVQLELASCDLRATVERAVALVEKQAHRQDISIAVAIADDVPALRADASQLKTCFSNILTNAVQAMPRGGQIRVTGRRISESGNAESVQLRFADSGPGIAREDREKVFAPYFSTKATGFGLGLAITKKIVEDHGGRIYVGESEGPGTVLVVELPLPAPSARRPAVIASSSRA